ncbi:putative RNA polymerase II transcription factor B subunit 1 [Lasiodiplodia theobromae]|uniref:Putative RNA polymerase II transcription factor B subunit 1 n=1 Tax=Lasiodiplodia theobromae TaxID=45133 RepID=A0A5N5DC51_9PEZI|nr:putative RNA polymerase II transcription factor B subunit 1 [Lasiodiplodia theobromae]
MSRVSASYKKQDGVLSVSKDNRTVLWTPAAPPGAPPSLTIAVSDITNLQQTPATSAKVSIKIVATESYVFAFTSPTARDDQVAITNTLRTAIEAAKARSAAASNAPTPAPAPDNTGQPSAMAIAKAVSGQTPAPATSASGAERGDDDGMYTDERLLGDVELQRSLLSKDLGTQKRFYEALKGKPESISHSQFSKQFWSTRVHLLRAHAVQLSQQHGPVNALSAIKLKIRDDGTPQTTLTRGQIQTIFNQHPLVRKAYNDLVPPMGEVEFFAAFFASRLYKRLKGEKITEMDPTNPKFDKYLNDTEENEKAKALSVEQFPHFLDIEGNESNHSQRKGNAPDMTMRPSGHDKVPILRSLNRVSGHMMADVTPADVDPHAPAGVDESTWEQLRLKDLQRSDEDNRVMLKIKDQRQFFARDNKSSAEAQFYAKQVPSDVLKTLRRELDGGSLQVGGNGVNLQSVINVDDNSDSDEDAKKPAPERVGTKAARGAATTQILSAIKQRRAQNNDYSTPLGTFAVVEFGKTGYGLSESSINALTLTHNTTVEFLHYFWAVYGSGDADRAGELGTLVETLERSIERVKAVAEEAEKERQQMMADAKKRIEQQAARTGRRARFDERAFKGGRAAVESVMRPTVEAVKKAVNTYREELKKQMALAQQAAAASGATAAS